MAFILLWYLLCSSLIIASEQSINRDMTHASSHSKTTAPEYLADFIERITKVYGTAAR